MTEVDARIGYATREPELALLDQVRGFARVAGAYADSWQRYLGSLKRPPASARPFGAEYDANKPITLTGTLTAMEWTNPHTHFYLDVKDEAGKVVYASSFSKTVCPGIRCGYLVGPDASIDCVGLEAHGAYSVACSASGSG